MFHFFTHFLKLPTRLELPWRYCQSGQSNRLFLWDQATHQDRMASLGWESYERAKNDWYSGHHWQIRLPNGTLAIDTYNVTGATKLGWGLQPLKIDFFRKNEDRLQWYKSLPFEGCCTPYRKWNDQTHLAYILSAIFTKFWQLYFLDFQIKCVYTWNEYYLSISIVYKHLH